jgi:hypothetical protein
VRVNLALERGANSSHVPHSVTALCGFNAVYGCIYDWVTLFTWYGHKNLVNTVLTAAVSDLAL